MKKEYWFDRMASFSPEEKDFLRKDYEKMAETLKGKERPSTSRYNLSHACHYN